MPPRRRAALAAWAAGVLALGAAACSTTAPMSPAATALAASADRIVDEVAANAHFNGAVVLMRDGVVVYERAVGLAQRQPDRPFTVDTPTDGGSLAKTMTAAAVWELAAEGRLSLDDAVVRHLPDYPYPDHSVRDLVTHRSGLPDYGAFDADFAPGQVRGTAELLRIVAQRRPPPARAPGVRVEYSNLGFDTAALVVERVTGRPIEVFWRERYLGPLGLQGMFARPARFADWPVPRVPGYRRTAGGWEPHDAYDGEAFIGASNVHASASAWARWGDAFARGRVMARERLDAGLSQAMLDSGKDNTLTMLSWYCDAARQRCHYTGAYNGFYAQVYWDRSRREVVAYVSNSMLPPWRCARLTRDLVDVLAGRTPLPETAPDLVPIAKGALARWAGPYVAPALGPLTLAVDGEHAIVRVGGGEPSSAFQVTRSVFYVPMLDLWLAFSGPPASPTLHIRSIFHVADAKRQAAPAGTS
jgi:CubicO group peptidase (beta-lactamase class C family)